jgi:hypothetical protein
MENVTPPQEVAFHAIPSSAYPFWLVNVGEFIVTSYAECYRIRVFRSPCNVMLFQNQIVTSTYHAVRGRYLLFSFFDQSYRV